MIVADGHALQIVGDVVHAQTGACHLYFTVLSGSVLACDGAGNPDPRPSVANLISQRLAGAIRRLHQSNERTRYERTNRKCE